MNFVLVDNQPKYYEFIREIRLHPENIKGFINSNFFSEEEQLEYMKKNEKFFKICLYNGEPVGFVGVIDNDIRVCTKPTFKKKGVGKFMINEILREFPNATAKIKKENNASIQLFKSCGFIEDFLIMKKK